MAQFELTSEKRRPGRWLSARRARAAGIVALAVTGAVALVGCASPGGVPVPSLGGASSVPAPGSTGVPAGSTTGPALPSACSLLTTDQVSALFGSAAGAPRPGLNATGSDESSCDWEPADAPLGVVTLLQLQVFSDTRYLSRAAYDDAEILQDIDVPGATEGFVIDEGSGIGINMVVGSERAVVHYTPGGGTDPASTLPALTIIASQIAAAVAAS